MESISIVNITPKGLEHAKKRLIQSLADTQGKVFAAYCEKYLLSCLWDSMDYPDKDGTVWKVFYIETSETVGIWGKVIIANKYKREFHI